MKKHIIAAMVGVMILAVTAPAFAAANVGGNLEFGYNLADMSPAAPSTEWGLSVTGNVSDDVSFKIGLEDYEVAASALPFYPNEAWIQAKNTPVGTVKLGAFDMAFGERNNTSWADDGALNVQVSNELAGMNVTAGAQINNAGEPHAFGASVNVQPMEAVDATVGVLATKNLSEEWEPAVGYQVNYTGIEHLNLGLKGNLKEEEIVGSAAYELMPGITVDGMYALNALNEDDEQEDSRMQAGISAKFENGLRAGASYAVVNETSKIMTVNGGYDFALTEGLTIALDGEYQVEDGTATNEISAKAAVKF
ncbi:MAG: hypothetical protein ACM3ZC_07100 [Bacteroidota bacterium]